MTEGADTALQQARRLLDEGTPLPASADVLAVAWALKALCYEAWNTDPTRAARAADAVRPLLERPLESAAAHEVRGLAEWTAGIACVTRGEMALAVQAFDAAAAALRLAGKPDPAAQTQVPKIMALSMLGKHDEATACAEAAQVELRALGNLGAAARVSLNLGNLLATRDAYAAAARHFREAAVLFARTGDRKHSVLADGGQAVQLMFLGDFEEALRLFARAHMRASSQGMELELAVIEESVSMIDLSRGRYREALAGLESTCRRYQSLAMPHYLATAEKQLADAYLELRLLPEALALFQTAVAKFRELGLVTEHAWALTQMGRTEALLGQTSAAQAFGEAAALFAAQGNPVGAAAVAQARAEFELAAGHGEAAMRCADDAAQGFAATGQADGSARADVIRAQAMLALGQVDGAEAAFQAALERARRLQQVQVQVRCLTGLGLTAQAKGRTADAKAHFEASIELFEEQRRVLPGDDIRSAFLADHMRPYQEQLRMALDEAQHADGSQVLLQLERARARSLSERLTEAGDGPEMVVELEGLRQRLNWLYRRVQRLQDDGEPSTALSQELQRTERDLLERARRGRLAAPAKAAQADAGFSVSELQRALSDGGALVEYGVVDDELFACVVTASKVTLVRHLAAWPEVLQAVQSARFQLETLRQGAAPVQQHMPVLAARATARLARLHALLWAPLRAALGACRRVLVVPHAQLGLLPFAALNDGGPPLGQQLDLAIVPSARTALRGLLRPPTAARQVLALGESTRLPHAAREAEAVAGLFDGGRSFVGDAASVANLRAHAAEADVLHLACHAQFRNDNPRFSALHLADGALTVEQAEGLTLKACTVVLSACETGLAEVSSGDEMVGLVRGFMVAGAARVLASLWPVDDEVTQSFMTDFYGALVAGAVPSQALRQAQAALQKSHPHPYFWSAFTLYGGW